jgi:HEAT repeat protein
LAGSGPVAGAVPARTVPGPSALQTALASNDPALRIDAIERLGDLSDPANMAALQQALTDPAEGVRAVAQQALQGRKQAHMPARGQRVP